MRFNEKHFEACVAFLLTCAAMVAIPLVNDGLGLSWDTLNHHVYLGWVANGARFDKDYFAAASQSYQFPYLNWPLYLLIKSGVSGQFAGVVWAIMHAMVSIPLWMIAYRLMPGITWHDAIARLLAVTFGVGNILVLRAPETTGNDVLSALPWLVAVVVGLGPVNGRTQDGEITKASWRAFWCGVLGGVAVAFKLSNAIVAIFLPLLCVVLGNTVSSRVRYVICCGVGAGVGFVTLYSWWGWQLWSEFGNPIYPFADSLFDTVRRVMRWQGVNHD